MCIDLLPEKLLQAMKKKEKWYEWNYGMVRTELWDATNGTPFIAL